MTLFGIGFATPWLLLTLLALPILWLILRAVPPAPIRRMFPGVVLLLGLKDDDQVSDRTPWWLLLLRMLAVAALIIGLAGPILNPQTDDITANDGPLLVVMDGSWASAASWRARTQALDGLLAQAARDDRRVALLKLSTPEPTSFQTADDLRARLVGLSPEPWEPGEAQITRALELLPEGDFDTYWMSDGLERDSRAPLLTTLQDRGTVTVFQAGQSILGLAPARFEDGNIVLTALRARSGSDREVTILAQGRDPAGNPAVLARATATFDANATATETALSLPSELRARITRFEIEGNRSAGATTLPDDSLRRREVALMAGREDREGLQLLSPLHYLEKALEPSADLLSGALMDMIPANPDVIALADVATMGAAEEDALLDWLDGGGILLRFAGQRLAASDISRETEDPLMPVRLRAGGRSVGGAMSWGEPKSLAEFSEDSPFYGLSIPPDVTVTAQVMAQPDPALAERVIAQLTDGTPLVTRKAVGQGQIILFHVTANAEWSSLPLSGLFVQMLERLAIAAGSASQPSAEDLAGTIWQPNMVLDAFGSLNDGSTLPGVPGENMVDADLGPDLRPGLYQSQDRTMARNVLSSDTTLTPVTWPSDITVEGLTQSEETPLAGWLLALAIALLLADIIASLFLSGRLSGPRATTAAGMVFALLLMPTAPAQAQSTEDQFALAATAEVTFAHVITGDTTLDRTAQAGLLGLSETLFFRTSVEPAAPVAVNLETDELAFFPFLYWPITPDQPTPSAEAYAKLNTYLRSGGMIMFDTRDADIARFGTGSPNGRKLQQLAAPLDIPPLEPVPEDHVLTRTFYLLQDFPGRHNSRDVWVEAAPPDAELVEGMPFRNLNDNVTPVIIGGNDWASAWAMDERGNALFPIGRGYSGERQREIAYRFGVNLVMHVLTGNYKSDQVHVPALLDRLGN
ncbi:MULTISPECIES: DUF4159 domain-containing protein [Marivita]|uniref:DUF4159 domain-containing protein n=1 Tax=Marivita cryptomonadis TaxID=505252 RepID=A0A9Q2S1S7_9RHOB|nr:MULTISPECIES: DUF4159 domain-containing protein [Marivita]MCR9169440.1 DUF4159 domain-containing protein [Paracoccaceae bacterium]MBM2321690.1 DUF4159 domain-containing protein [Marivita cryptomonadis]MBM2331271.1 DUF4159 domain-containing protein [Marivita cryptomonadis]MBM2340857.1 DUF4159 domain-containing protein [Marivita cryptomonadis]MBM2345519.1 DUF4159 domain-containing protein [Marivita cryptomonadis]